MSVVLETTVGDITVDLYIKEKPLTSFNFIKLCKKKCYNFCFFEKIERNFIVQSGDYSQTGGQSIFFFINGEKTFNAECYPRIKHKKGTLSMVNNGSGEVASQFFLTLDDNLSYLDEKHIAFGEVVEGLDVLDRFNKIMCDDNNRPYKDVFITHTVILHDPFEDPAFLCFPVASPKPPRKVLNNALDELDDMLLKERDEMIKSKEEKANATLLEMVGDIYSADAKPSDKVLFICNLNEITTSDDLRIIFSRFGKIKSSKIIRDKETQKSLKYAFIEFEEKESCEKAYCKMNNILIDDRRIRVDFSQSVSKFPQIPRE